MFNLTIPLMVFEVSQKIVENRYNLERSFMHPNWFKVFSSKAV